MDNGTVLTVVQETVILGKKIQLYGSVEVPLFLASDVAEWIEHSQTSKMVKSVDDDEKLMGTLFLSGQNREAWFLTEDGLYEVCMQSRKPIAKEMKKEIKQYLKSIRLTGVAIPVGDEQKIVIEIPDNLIQVIILDISGIYAQIHNQGYFNYASVVELKKQYSDSQHWRVVIVD